MSKFMKSLCKIVLPVELIKRESTGELSCQSL